MCGTTRYTRDPFGRVTEIIEPNGAGIELTWTPGAYLARRVVPHGGSFGYDAAGRLVLAASVLAPEFVPRYDN